MSQEQSNGWKHCHSRGRNTRTHWVRHCDRRLHLAVFYFRCFPRVLFFPPYQFISPPSRLFLLSCPFFLIIHFVLSLRLHIPYSRFFSVRRRLHSQTPTMSLLLSDNLAPQPVTDVFTDDTCIDRRKCQRTVPMKVLALGVGRTGTACECHSTEECLRTLSTDSTQLSARLWSAWATPSATT